MNLWNRMFRSTQEAESLTAQKAEPLIVPTRSLQDLRVIIPESLLMDMNADYLDFDINPLQLTEIQRVGRFLLEHLAASLNAYNDLVIITRKYEEEKGSHVATRKELASLGNGFEEIVLERDGLKSRWRDAIAELEHVQKQVAQLREQIAGLQEAASYDKQYIASLEKKTEELKMDHDVRDEYE